MPLHKREVVNHRRQQVGALYVKGRLQTAIARELGISQPQVSHDLKAIQRAWLASSIRDFDLIKAEQLAKIDQIERAAWESFERSLQVREITVQEVTDGESRTNKVSIRKEQQVGDPRFLQIAQRCIDQRCDILGLSTSAEAAKTPGTGLAALLAQAHGTVLPPLPMAEA
jgi:hypothetical protein